MPKPILIKAPSWVMGLFLCATMTQMGCSQDSGSSQFNFLETDKNSGKNAPCGFSSSLPESDSVRATGQSGGTTSFAATPNNPECTVEYYLNGSLLMDFTGANINLPSSRLNPGVNTLVARVSGAKLSTSLPLSRTWQVTKNRIPTCANPIPAANGNSTGVGGRFDMTITVDDEDNDTLTHSWTLNGNTAPSGFITSAITGATLSGYFVAQEANRGSMAVRAIVSDGTDEVQCPWNINVNDSCAFSAFSPTTTSPSTVRVANLGTTITQFVAVPNNNSCQVSWLLNGTPFVNGSTVISMLSSNLNSGSNTLKAVITDGISSVEKEWTVRKNTPPTCASQNPTSNGGTVTSGANILMTATASDADSDTMTFGWTLNGTTPPAGVFLPASTSPVSLNTFFATPGVVGTGAQSVVATFNDGYDNGTCSWTVNVSSACSITGASPATPVRVANADSTSTTFSVTTSDPGCPVGWTLNGAPLAGTSSTRVLLSSAMNSGTNILVATAANGTPQTWFINKNSPPLCGTQSPAVVGSTVGVGVSQVFGITPSDANAGETFTFNWKVNGLTPPAQFVPNNGSASAQGTYTPIANQAGNQTITVDVNDSFDTTVCSWQTTVVPQCSFTSISPASSSHRVSAIPSTSNQFTVLPNDSSCNVEWRINNGPIVSTSTAINILSSQLTDPSNQNTVSARLFNAVGSTTQIWNVTRNVAPVCATQSPSATGSSVGVGQQLNYAAGITDTDAVTFDWKLNGITVPGVVLSVTTIGNASNALFSPTVSQVGAVTVTANVSDGIDSTTCSWATAVSPNCEISSKNPSGASLTISQEPAAIASFGVVPNDATCAVTWRLNGTVVGSNVFQTITSMLLNAGDNTVTAEISNGTSSDSETWTLTQNTPPTCNSQTPGAAGVQINIGTPQNFSGTASDINGHALTYSWRWNGSSAPSLFDNITSGSGNFGARFTPGVGQVGSNQSLSTSISDGYDSTTCNWDVTVNDPNTVHIQACLPAGNPVVVTSTGTNSSRDFTISATGTGLSYVWKLNGNTQSGQTAPNFNLTAGTLAVGNHVLEATVTDMYNNSDTCTYNIKRNAPPVLASPNPANTTSFKMNYTTNQSVGISATDANGDALTYAWKLDGNVQGTYLASGASTSNFNPLSQTSLLGARTVSVEVSDGSEIATQTWSFEVNTFSTQCNTVMNGPVTGVGSTGGTICTLVGYPGVGHLTNPLTDDPSKIRIRPVKVIEDDLGNMIFTDHISHAVFYYNRSVSQVVRFGQTIPAGRMAAILGAGANGENSSTLSSGLTYKMSSPMGIAFDDESGRLYVADFNNHRVIYITTSSNAPVRVLGTGANQNDSTRNTDGAKGDTQGCVSPAELILRGTGANRRLYVACSSSNAIKVVNVDHLSGAYGDTTVLVGRAVGGVTQGGYSDGSLGLSGEAEVIGPWAMTFDPSGVLFFTEGNTAYNHLLAQNSNSFRVRALNLGASTSNLLSGGTVGVSTRLHARDMSGSPLPRVTADVIPALGNAASTLYVNGPSLIHNNACQPYEVIVRDASGVASRTTTNLTVNLTTSGFGTLYSDSACTSVVTNRTINSGNSNSLFYFKHSVNGTGTITVSASGFTATGANISVVTPLAGSANSMTMVAAPSFFYPTCSLVVILGLNSGSLATTSVSRNINVVSNSGGQFYQDPTCSGSPVSTVTMAANASTVNLYYARTVKIEPNRLVSVLGQNQTETGYSGIQSVRGNRANIPEYGELRLWWPRGIEVDWSGGSLRGLFVTSWDQQRIEYVNNSGTNLVIGTGSIGTGGATIPAGDQFDIVGYYGGGFVDETTGPNSRINVGYHLSKNRAGTELWLADHNNGRVRAFSLTDGGLTSSTLIGSGYLRSGFANDSAAPATETRLNRPFRMDIDNTNRELFFSDRWVCRIRKLSMITGLVETAISRGCNDVTTVDVAEMVWARSVRDILITTVSGVRWILFSDNQEAGNNAINSTSMIRAYNTSAASASIFGRTVPARSVSNIAGDFNRGTGSWDLPVGSNTDGMNAIDARLFNPDGIALMPDGSMYIAQYNDHCIVKMAANGTISRFLGVCDTVNRGMVDGPLFDGSMNRVAQTLQPGKIVPDPLYGADGNFFFTDGVGQGTSRLRYVNFRNTAVTIGDIEVAAATSASNPTVRTLVSATTPTGQGGMMGLAIFDNQICYSTGSWWADGNWGAHNVVCYNRYSPIAQVVMRVGPSATDPTRAGGPFGLEQEGVSTSSALLNGPTDIKFDSNGNLYIIDGDNHMIRFVRRWW